MAIFTISDLHLSLSVDKPMDIFGSAWADYVPRLQSQWNELVSDDDTVFVGGDVSWAMNLDECFEDFDFINKLNGKKVISKGNHDYWWESMTKMNRFLADNEFSSISFMQNNAFVIDGLAVCGTRGWTLPGDSGFSADDRKIYDRELQRLALSFDEADRICKKDGITPQRKICILHYPPFTKSHELDFGFVDLMHQRGVDTCFYGHLHASAAYNAYEGEVDGITYKLVSADYLKFKPIKI